MRLTTSDGGVERRYRSLPTSRNDCEWFETMAVELTSCQWKLDTRPQRSDRPILCSFVCQSGQTRRKYPLFRMREHSFPLVEQVYIRNRFYFSIFQFFFSFLVKLKNKKKTKNSHSVRIDFNYTANQVVFGEEILRGLIEEIKRCNINYEFTRNLFIFLYYKVRESIGHFFFFFVWIEHVYYTLL